jgi:thiol:disulfide interchange protein DsbC
VLNKRTEYEKRFIDVHPAGGHLSGAAHADSAAIKQSLAKLGVQSTDIQPSPVSGMSRC